MFRLPTFLFGWPKKRKIRILAGLCGAKHTLGFRFWGFFSRFIIFRTDGKPRRRGADEGGGVGRRIREKAIFIKSRTLRTMPLPLRMYVGFYFMGRIFLFPLSGTIWTNLGHTTVPLRCDFGVPGTPHHFIAVVDSNTGDPYPRTPQPCFVTTKLTM